MKTLSKRIRLSFKMTQVAFAKELGISQQLVSDWDTGRADLSIRDEYALLWLRHLLASRKPSAKSL